MGSSSGARGALTAAGLAATAARALAAVLLVTAVLAVTAATAHAQPSSALRARITAVAIEEGFDPAAALALIAIESSFDTLALGQNGPLGLMQIKLGTAVSVMPGVKRSDLFDPETNVRAGLRYLRSLMERYDGDLETALRAYKGGPRTVDAGRGRDAATNSYLRRFRAARERYAASATPTPAPSPSPSLFAPGVVTVAHITTYRPTFIDAGATVYYTMEAGTNYVIVYSQKREGKWTEPRIAEFSGKFPDAEVIASPDGSRLVFSSKRPTSAGGSTRTNYDLWSVERGANGVWGEPMHLGADINTDANEMSPSMTSNGVIHFSRNSPTGHDLYSAMPTGTGAVPGYAVSKLPAPVNTGSREAGGWVAPDESFLIFESNRDGGLGGNDIYISHRTRVGWSPPKNLGAPFNTPAGESSPTLSADQMTIYISGNRRVGEFTADGMTYRELLAKLNSPAVAGPAWHIFEMLFDAVRTK